MGENHRSQNKPGFMKYYPPMKSRKRNQRKNITLFVKNFKNNLSCCLSMF